MKIWADFKILALGDTPAKVKAETVSATLAQVKAQPLVDALAGTLKTLAGVETGTVMDTVAQVKAETLFDALANTLIQMES